MKKMALVLSLLLSAPVYSALTNESEAAHMLQGTPQLAENQVSQLSYTAQNMNASLEERVAAFHQLAHYPSQNALVAVSRGLREQQIEIREAAIAASVPYQLDYRWRLISPLLKDEESRVRNAAALNLVNEFAKLGLAQQKLLTKPVDELKQSLMKQELEQDKLVLANVYRWTGEWDKAQALYVSLTSEAHNSTPENWLNYADNFRIQRKDLEALDVLDKGLLQFPNNANLHYSKALTLVRLDDKNLAANVMNHAAELAQSNSYFWYLNGVLQELVDIERSLFSFEKAYSISGAPEQLYALCDIYIKTDSPKKEACMEELRTIAPEHVIEALLARG